MSNQLEPFQVVKRTVRVRRGEGYTPKKDAELVDGQTFEFSVGWLIESDIKIYAGEWTLIPVDFNSWPAKNIAWIASGDTYEAL